MLPRLDSVRFRFHPADVATLILLATVNAALLLACLDGKPLWDRLYSHAMLLLAFFMLSWVMAKHVGAYQMAYVRTVAIVGIMFTLYGSLGYIAFRIWPATADGFLARLDRVLFLGASPSLWLNKRLSFWDVEFLSFIYCIFIPYLYLSIILGCVGRPASQTNEFITAYAVMYCLAFLGYLFVPSRGPVVELAGQFPVALAGGHAHALVLKGIQEAGGPHGAFPSLHIGASAMVCLFDLRYNHIRGMTYIPLVVLIAVATVGLQYHYVIDLLAGISIAVASLALARRAMQWHGGAACYSA